MQEQLNKVRDQILQTKTQIESIEKDQRLLPDLYKFLGRLEECHDALQMAIQEQEKKEVAEAEEDKPDVDKPDEEVIASVKKDNANGNANAIDQEL